MSQEYIVTLNPKKINFMPESEVVEILQNVYTILSTMRYTAPLYREFGASATYLDDPHEIAKMKHTREVMEIVEMYEPRAFIVEILYYSSEIDGKIYPAVKVRLRGVTE